MQPSIPIALLDLRSVVSLLQNWFQVLNKISFGILQGAVYTPDNVDCQIIQKAFAAANVENGITHQLGRVPSGYMIVGSNVSCNIYQLANTGTAWTSTTIYLKCDQIATVNILIF